MRLEPANRVRLHSFPPKVTKLTLNTPFELLFTRAKHMFILSPVLWPFPVFRDKVPPAESLGSPRTGAVSGPDHPALLSPFTRRRTVSASQVLLHFRLLSQNVCKPKFVYFPGVHPSWVSCCWHKDIITGRPLFQEALLTGSGWLTAQPIETVHWGKTACHGVCSVSPHHQGMFNAFPTNLLYV